MPDVPDNTSTNSLNDGGKSINSTYVDSIDYDDWSPKIKDVIGMMDENAGRLLASRKLRYAEIDIEGQRKTGGLAPDELYIPRHIIDTNIRREQSSYVQYVTQSNRAVILQDVLEPTTNTSILEHDVTTRLRFDGWQQAMYALIDGFQQNGYGIMEVVQDLNQPGEVAHEYVQLGDFGFIMDTRNIQECELVSRAYYFTKTKLLGLCEQKNDPWSKEEVNNIIDKQPTADTAYGEDSLDARDKSLYKAFKVMFRKGGIVQVGWCNTSYCSNWLRTPRSLFLGRRKLFPPEQVNPMVNPSMTGISASQQPTNGLPLSEPVYEKSYPYFVAPYLISENNTISQLKGRVYLDQDTQEASSSLISSFCTKFRRSAGLYFSKKTNDPNDDIMMQKDVFFKQGALINADVQEFKLDAPDSSMINAISQLDVINQSETSQVAFAVNNRKDSRKTATENNLAATQQQSLTTTQVVLFSTCLREMYTSMFEIVQSRVLAGLIKVSPDIQPLYTKKYVVKPSGDTDVIERQQLVQTMMSAWPVVQATPINMAFLGDLLMRMFPETGLRYVQILQQAEQQKQSAQAQQIQQGMALLQTAAKGVSTLASHKEYFSEIGQLHAYPMIQQAAEKVQEFEQQQQSKTPPTQ